MDGPRMSALSTPFDTTDPFSFLKSHFFGLQSPAPYRADHNLLSTFTRPATCAGHSASSSPPTILGGSGGISLLSSLYTPFLRELIFSQLPTGSFRNTVLRNFKPLTSHSRPYSCQHFKISSHVQPSAKKLTRLLWKTSSHFNWSISIDPSPSFRSQNWKASFDYFISSLISIEDTTRF